MSIESAKAFLERCKNDDEWRDKLKAAKDQDARIEMVKAEGFDFTPAELESVTEELSDGELSELDLMGVSGGGFCILGGCGFPG